MRATIRRTVHDDDLRRGCAAVLDELGVERAHVYGQSFGGMVAQEMALTHPDRVRTLVARVDASRSGACDRGRRSNRPEGRAVARSTRPASRGASRCGGRGSSRVRPPSPTIHAGSGDQWEAMQTWDALRPALRIAVPTLVLHGTEDAVVAPGNAELLARRIRARSSGSSRAPDTSSGRSSPSSPIA